MIERRNTVNGVLRTVDSHLGRIEVLAYRSSWTTPNAHSGMMQPAELHGAAGQGRGSAAGVGRTNRQRKGRAVMVEMSPQQAREFWKALVDNAFR
ncbi:hypothetical protein AB0O05_40305 [Streptomyces sp. NPDC093084]|uniref:hypothetical protein n=1 Tax=Streptomyces sp. NPDC093084 TaxID=3155197 RepID=UPI003424B49B